MNVQHHPRAQQPRQQAHEHQEVGHIVRLDHVIGALQVQPGQAE
jgi:hypothetical protein